MLRARQTGWTRSMAVAGRWPRHHDDGVGSLVDSGGPHEHCGTGLGPENEVLLIDDPIRRDLSWTIHRDCVTGDHNDAHDECEQQTSSTHGFISRASGYIRHASAD